MRNPNMFLKKMTALAMVLMFLIASSAMRVEAAATPDLTSEQIEEVLEEVFTKLAAFDAQGVVNHFASDAVLEDPVGTPPINACRFETAPDGFHVPGGQRFHAAECDSAGDHRIAMAFAVAALAADGPCSIEGADAASVSFPEFFSTLRQIAR